MAMLTQSHYQWIPRVTESPTEFAGPHGTQPVLALPIETGLQVVTT